MAFETSFLGLIDSLNLCNLSVTVLLASIAYSFRFTRSRIVSLAIAFLGSQALVYFFLGIGVLGVLDIFQGLTRIPQHLVTRVAASITFVFGGVVFANAIWPDTINIPHLLTSFHKHVRKGLFSLGIVGAVLAGILLALHSIPCACTVGVYFTFLSSISNSELGIIELLVYVILYVTPSAIILVASLNKYTYTYINMILNKGRIYKVVLGMLMALAAIMVLLTT